MKKIIVLCLAVLCFQASAATIDNSDSCCSVSAAEISALEIMLFNSPINGEYLTDLLVQLHPESHNWTFAALALTPAQARPDFIWSTEITPTYSESLWTAKVDDEKIKLPFGDIDYTLPCYALTERL